MDKSRYRITEDIWLDARRAVWVESNRTLAVADLHLGYAWAHREGGQMLPLIPGESLLNRLLELQRCYEPSKIILLGDVLHRALPLPQIKLELDALYSVLEANSEIIWVAGNHDRGIQKLNLRYPVVPAFKSGPYYFIHGDAPPKPETSVERIFLGHEHPAISVGDGVTTSLKCPCFLVAEGALILPAFSHWAAGSPYGAYPFMSKLAQGARFHTAVAILNDKLLPMPLSR